VDNGHIRRFASGLLTCQGTLWIMCIDLENADEAFHVVYAYVYITFKDISFVSIKFVFFVILCLIPSICVAVNVIV